MNHPDEQRLTEYAGGETAEPAEHAEVERHLRECAACRASFESLQRVLAAASAMSVPEPEAGYEARLWQQLRPQLEPRAARPGWREWFAPRRLALAGAMASLVLVAFLAGRFWPRPGVVPATSPEAGVTPQVRERILLVAVGDHLDRAQSVLIEISNAEPGTGTGDRDVDISRQQQRAQDLLSANRLYRQTAQHTGDTSVAGFLDELEPLLVEIANSPAKVPGADLEELQRRIAAHGLLLKVRVLTSNVHEREKAAAPAQPQNSL
ncbi:MAG TPA: zf-HC2 domain-containing protein [Candidatus Acidoferrales bacterium]|nr:zf-HC2 domain-containing protein [Candidatus Acidoferrales bacterium]